MLQIAGRAKLKNDKKHYPVYGYLTDAMGNVTHINLEANPVNACWEPIKDFEVNYQVTLETSEH